MSKPSSLPTFSFTHHPSSSPFTVRSAEYLANTSPLPAEFLATGALVFKDAESPDRRILLIQRAASDSMPNRWEIPGGGVDDEDASILNAVARELWEEAGLIAADIGPLVGEGHFFQSRSGKRICKFNFLVEAKADDGKLEVKLDPKEHQNFLWASEEEVKVGKAGDVELKFTTKEQEATILEAFRVKKAS